VRASGQFGKLPEMSAKCPPMSRLEHLLRNNRAWADGVVARQPDFFARLVAQQSPRYLWIGCADSRVPANEIVDLAPGELFVHRNVANLVIHTDLNCLSVMQYAVDVLKVQDIIVTGHYGCGGVAAAMQSRQMGLIDNWLRHVQDIRDRHTPLLEQAGPAALDRLCEVNVLEQALNVCRTTVVKDAWDRGQRLTVHAWCYSVADGLVRDLNFGATGEQDSGALLQQALMRLPPPQPGG
jgi:carbonic anhydrase